MLHQILSYLKFLLRSRNAHGVHSPFVYALVTRCLYDKTSYPEYRQLHAYSETLSSSKEVLSVTDHGAGSRVFKSNRRKVSDIAKKAGATQKGQQFLFRLARYLAPETILELGTSLGKGTAALSWGSPASRIDTVEGCPETARVAGEVLKAHGLEAVHVYRETFTQFLNREHQTYGMIWLDGHHDRDHTLRYFDLLLKNHISGNTVLLLDDIHWSPGMTRAWEIIKAHPAVSVTLDTWHQGLVFFRKGQAKEHFCIRM